MSIKEKLSHLNFDADISNGDEPQAQPLAVRHGDLIMVGALPLNFTRQDEEGELEFDDFRRFTSEHNIDFEATDNATPEKNQLIAALKMGMAKLADGGVFHATKLTDGNSPDDLIRCLSANIKVCATPTFENVGLLGFFAANRMMELFEGQPRPVIDCAGVNSLPAKRVISASFTFVTKSA